jgi:hypothetical protein
MAEQGIGGFNIDDDGNLGGGGGTNGSAGSSGTSGNNNTSGSKDKKIKKIYINGGTSDGATGIGNSISGQVTQGVAVVNVGGTSGTAGTSGTGGTSGKSSDDDIKDIPPKLGGPNFQLLEKIATDYLNASSKAGMAEAILSGYPEYKEVLEVYVDEKLGFRKLKDEVKQMVEDNPDMTEAEYKAEIKKRRKAAIEYYLNEGRDELEQIYNDLKQKVIDFAKEIESIAKVIVQKTSLVLVPSVLGPIVPNPITNVLGFISLLYDIKSKLDKIFASILIAIGFIKKLGMYDTKFVKGFTDKVIAPIEKMMSKVDDAVAESEKATAVTDAIEGAAAANKEFDKQYITKIPGGATKDGVWCRQFAEDRYEIKTIPFWHASGEQKMLLEIIDGSRGDGEKEWAQTIHDYNLWVKSMPYPGRPTPP